MRLNKHGCTRCSIPGHKWKNCRRPIQVSTIGRRKVDKSNLGKFLLDGSFGVRYSDSEALSRYYIAELVKKI